MRLWLAQRFGFGRSAHGGTEAAGEHANASSKPMSMESLEHMVRSRVRMFLRNTWLVTILGTAVLGGGLWAAFYFMTAPTVMRIAAGPIGSANAKLVQVMAQQFAADRDKIRLELVATDGPKESEQKITSGAADLAILPSTIGSSPDWPVVAIIRQNVVALIVPAPATPPPAAAKKEAPAPEKKEAAPEKAEKPVKATGKHGKAAKAAAAKAAKAAKKEKGAKAAKGDDDTDTSDEKAASGPAGDTSTKSENDDSNKIEKVAQLAGHRIGIVTGNAATRELLNFVLNHYGVAPDKVQVSLIDPNNLADAVRSDQLDAIFVAGSPTGHAINEAAAAASRNGNAPSFIAIDHADGIAKRSPAFDSADVDAGTFGGNPPTPDDDLKSLSFPEYLVARKSFSAEAIATLSRLIYTSRVELASELPGEIKIEAPSTDKDASAVVHPGALIYLNDDQKSFFDKYGDAIFYGLLIFPIFGSAIAGVAGYFRSSGRTRRLRLLQRLLDLVRKAHVAPTLDALNQIQVEVDHLVVAIIHQGEHEEYDQTVQTSFSLALDQVRFAIAARRTVLLGGHETNIGSKAAAA
jgi:TRAP-type uncharacterized transport system substrate-binding protein